MVGRICCSRGRSAAFVIHPLCLQWVTLSTSDHFSALHRSLLSVTAPRCTAARGELGNFVLGRGGM
jgi:hypothetical protein